METYALDELNQEEYPSEVRLLLDSKGMLYVLSTPDMDRELVRECLEMALESVEDGSYKRLKKDSEGGPTPCMTTPVWMLDVGGFGGAPEGVTLQ